MAAAFSWFLGLRYLVSRRASLLALLGVAIAVWALIVVVAVFSGFISGIRDNTRRASPDLLLTGLPDPTSFDAVDAHLRLDDDVVATSPRLRLQALFYAPENRIQPIQRVSALLNSPLQYGYVELLGIDVTREHAVGKLPHWLADIESYNAVEDPDRPLAISPDRVHGRSIGRRLRAPPGLLLSSDRLRRYEPGDRLAVVGVHEETDAAGAPVLRKLRRGFVIAGGFQSRNRVFDWTQALVDIEEVRSLVGHDAADPRSIDVVSDVAITVRPDADLAAVAARLEQRLGLGRVLTWEQQNALYLDVVDQERAMMKLVMLVVVVVAVFLIYATMHMLVTQKIKDIGIIASMGASRRGIQDVFLLCGSTVGALGCVLGASSGWLTAAYLDEIDRTVGAFVTEVVNAVSGWFGGDPVGPLSLFPRSLFALDRIPTQVEPSWVAQVAIGALVMSLIAAWLPARRAAAFEPVRALAYE